MVGKAATVTLFCVASTTRQGIKRERERERESAREAKQRRRQQQQKITIDYNTPLVEREKRTREGAASLAFFWRRSPRVAFFSYRLCFYGVEVNGFFFLLFCFILPRI
ncbi:hypothetical protein TRSC58_07280 [Trypanosoma rangeli SC58]|uniref:Uncharacterized protein n=1 Tax=Trypanosoma rangeli SC58 TaxID=429131 RepID=A0A061IVT8_TRYRA|nr:hypothetical protein TRSC58_07280 [Trypanosoma rangeli SC58]